jgi:transcriptional regulator with XRE-family HTH domain
MFDKKTNTNYKLILQKRLKSRRLFLNLTYEELSNKIGISKSTLQRYESGGIKNISYDKVLHLSEALGVSPEYFLDFSMDYTADSPPETKHQSQYGEIKIFDTQEEFEQRVLEEITPKLISENYKLERKERGFVCDLIASKGSIRWYLDFFHTNPENFNNLYESTIQNKFLIKLGRIAVHEKPISKYSFIVDNDNTKDFMTKHIAKHLTFETSVILIASKGFTEYRL